MDIRFAACGLAAVPSGDAEEALAAPANILTAPRRTQRLVFAARRVRRVGLIQVDAPD